MAYEDAISAALGAETPIECPKPVVQEHTDAVDFEAKVREFRSQMATNATLDYKDARENMRTLITGAMEVFDDVLAAVVETRGDKAIHALTDFMKTVTDMNKRLVDLNADVTKSKTMQQESKELSQEVQPQNQTNVVIVGNAKDVFENSAADVNKRFGIDYTDETD